MDDPSVIFLESRMSERERMLREQAADACWPEWEGGAAPRLRNKTT